MRKHIIVFIIFLLLAFSLLYFNYIEESNTYYNKMVHIGEGKGSSNIIVSVEQVKQETVYSLFKKYLDKYNGNIFCPVILNESGKQIYIKYVYFTDAELFKDIQLESGRVFTALENESDKFISTLDKNVYSQIGKIANFSGKRHFEIRTLKSCKLDDVFERILTLNFENSSDIDNFIKDLKNEGIQIQKKYGAIDVKINQFNPFIILVAVSFILLILLIFYSLLNTYKKIAIEKMLGFSKFTIWFKRIFPIAIIEIVAIIAISCIMVLINMETSRQLIVSFLIKVYSTYGLMFIVSIIFLSIPFIYIKKITILSMLKNKKPIKEIILFNTFIKTGLIILLLVLMVDQYTKLQVIMSTYNKSYSNWEKTKEYAVIPSVQKENFSNYDPYSIEEKEKNKKLYFAFADKGAILADFYNFIPGIYELNKHNTNLPYVIEVAKVNPEYLQINNIIDENGEIVNISESETSFILLVPEKYHSDENKILDYYQDIANPSRQDSDNKHNQDEDSISEELELEKIERNIKIIWIKNQQNFFTYNLEINPNSGNCVKDPIVRVLTKSNGDLLSYNMVAGYMGNPLKIKITNLEDPTGEIISEFKKYYDLSVYNFPVKIIYDLVDAEIKVANEQIRFLSLVILLLIIMIVTIIFHNVGNYYEQNRLKLAIQRFHGYKLFDKFYGYLFGLFISWAIILPISVWIYSKLFMVYTIILLFIFEIIVSIIIFFIVEKRKILKVTKGG